MKVNYELDQDGCLDVVLIENSVDWHKEEGGDNILLQYINGGESMRIVERFPEDVDIAEAHHHGKSLMVKFSDGNMRGYYQDKMGNYKLLSELQNQGNENNKNGQNIKNASKLQNNDKMLIGSMMQIMNSRVY